MTEKQFWMKLDQLAGQRMKIPEFIQVLRQGYEEDLGIPIACHHEGLDRVSQMYQTVDKEHPNRDGNRYMICYTSRELADSDPMASEHWEKVPVRAVIDNALAKPVIGGFVFNLQSDKKFTLIPKQFLGTPVEVSQAVKDLVTKWENEGDNRFIFYKN